MIIRKTTVVTVLVYLFVVIGLWLIPFSTDVNKLIAVGTLVLSAVWFFRCRRSTYLMIMSAFIAYANYSIVVGIYLDESLRPKYLYPQITDVNVYGIGISVLFLTMIALVGLTPSLKKRTESISNEFIRHDNYDSALFFACAMAFIIIMMVGYTRGDGERGASSPLYEYGSIFVILMFYFSGRKKEKVIICGCLCLAYSLISLKNGTRIEALVCIIIFALCYFNSGIRPIYLFAGMIAGIFAFSTVGVLRGNWDLLITNGVSIFGEIIHNKLVFDTCTHAYFPVLCMIEEFRSISIARAMHYFGAFVLSIFVGQSRVADGDLIKIVARKYYHNFGGVSPIFFYIWFSYMGPLIFAIVVRFYINVVTGAYQNSKKYIDIRYCAILYVVASVPRWYLYGPWSLFRGVMICLIVFYIFQKFHEIIKER